MKKKILNHNSPEFLKDIKRVNKVVVYANLTNNFFPTSKRIVLNDAKETKIIYEMRDDIYVVKRIVMVIY